MQHESTGCFACECGRSYEILWSQIRFGEAWHCRSCQWVIQIGCAEQWKPQTREISAPKSKVIQFWRAA